MLLRKFKTIGRFFQYFLNILRISVLNFFEPPYPIFPEIPSALLPTHLPCKFSTHSFPFRFINDMSGSAYVNLIDSIFKNLYKDRFYIQKSLQKLSIILMVINRLLQSDLVKKVNDKYGIKVSVYFKRSCISHFIKHFFLNLKIRIFVIFKAVLAIQE